jgi:hypothetical protein
MLIVLKDRGNQDLIKEIQGLLQSKFGCASHLIGENKRVWRGFYEGKWRHGADHFCEPGIFGIQVLHVNGYPNDSCGRGNLYSWIPHGIVS